MSSGRKGFQRWSTAALLLLIILLILLALAGAVPGQATPGTLPPPDGPAGAPPSAPPAANEVLATEGDAEHHVQVSEGQILVVSLGGNMSTGYRWDIARSGPALRQAGGLQVNPGSLVIGGGSAPPILGAPDRQVLRFQPVSAGDTTLTLVYHRPWEDLPPNRTITLYVQTTGAFASPPFPLPDATEPARVPRASTGPVTTAALPASYNWCANNGCTAVRNQGQCGSCWAFSTVGALESSILIQDGLAKDLSEQYLVSCDKADNGCSGGWFAHDYHQWKYDPPELAAGAVYESSFPYVASDVVCATAHTHHERIATWMYIDTEFSVPSVAAIKQAMLTYGPVAAAMYVGSDFQSYRGGVFASAQDGQVNHAIVLVGWDDADGAWILRNSWGPYWGESGYMRIAYNTSSVGYGANYVVYRAGSPTPTPSPTPTAYVMRVNSGGKRYEDKAGNIWKADRAYVAGSWGYVGPITGTRTTTATISGTNDPVLYQTERNNLSAYRFTVPSAAYTVTLKFAEIRYNRADKSVFNVKLEAAPRLIGFDVWLMAGQRNTAVDRVLPVDVSDGILNIRFAAITGPTHVSAIEVMEK